MKQVCQICGKTYNDHVRKWSKLRGKYNPSQRSSQKPNLQWVRLENGERVKACTKCIKALSKTSANKRGIV